VSEPYGVVIRLFVRGRRTVVGIEHLRPGGDF
jgi:hypothetical protein